MATTKRFEAVKFEEGNTIGGKDIFVKWEKDGDFVKINNPLVAFAFMKIILST